MQQLPSTHAVTQYTPDLTGMALIPREAATVHWKDHHAV